MDKQSNELYYGTYICPRFCKLFFSTLLTLTSASYRSQYQVSAFSSHKFHCPFLTSGLFVLFSLVAPFLV